MLIEPIRQHVAHKVRYWPPILFGRRLQPKADDWIDPYRELVGFGCV
jgi:hypothetical protein